MKRSLNTWLLCGPKGHLNLNNPKWVQSTGIQGSKIGYSLETDAYIVRSPL